MTCRQPSCPDHATSRGWCGRHYCQARSIGLLDAAELPPPRPRGRPRDVTAPRATGAEVVATLAPLVPQELVQDGRLSGQAWGWIAARVDPTPGPGRPARRPRSGESVRIWSQRGMSIAALSRVIASLKRHDNIREE